MKKPISVAVVGCGIGRAHVKAYLELPERFALKVICDLDQEKAKSLAAASEVPEVCSSVGELCKRPDIEVIDLCTPPHLHFEQIQEVLHAGKHVICEKPLVASLEEADLLAEVERGSGRRIIPIFQYRFGHGLQKLKRLRAAGVTGEALVSTVETAWRRRSKYYEVPWRGNWSTELGGAVLGHAIHAHDMLYYILGPAKRVFCRTATRVNPIEVEDCASASLEMRNGSLATLSVTLGSSSEITRHRFCFSGMSAESNNAPYTNSKDPWTFTGDTPGKQQEIEEALKDFVPAPESFAGQFYRL